MNERIQHPSAYREYDLWESMRNQNDRNYRRLLQKQRAKAAKRKGA
ncbi:hypothetical protein [Pantoea vagans]|nr:hypothetical protein [Pantoea vagans]